MKLNTILAFWIGFVIASLMVGCAGTTPARVNQMHDTEKLAHDAGVARREKLLDAFEDDLVDAHDFQGELAFRFRAVTEMVEDKIVRADLERGLKDWAKFRAKMRINRDLRRVKRGDARAEDPNYNRAHASSQRWMGRQGISEETQDQLAEDATAITNDIVARQTAIAAAEATARENARIAAENAAKEEPKPE